MSPFVLARPHSRARWHAAAESAHGQHRGSAARQLSLPRRVQPLVQRRLYDACEQLPDPERRRDRGAFFRSVHGSLNHLLWADRLWLRRFASQGWDFAALRDDLLLLPPGAVHATTLHEDWSALRAARSDLDAAIEQWVRDMPAAFLLSTMQYANMRQQPRAHPTWQALTHFFNHQTHHRGQVTTLLSQAGIDVGLTDAIALV